MLLGQLELKKMPKILETIDGNLSYYKTINSGFVRLHHFIFEGNSKSTIHDVRSSLEKFFGGDYLDRMIERCRNVKGTPRIKWQLDIATDNLNRALHRKIIR